jgi:hypothetical protein
MVKQFLGTFRQKKFFFTDLFSFSGVPAGTANNWKNSRQKCGWHLFVAWLLPVLRWAATALTV